MKKMKWVLGALTLAAILLFGVYGASLGPISSDSNDWGAFGSLLGGFFTFVASVFAFGAFYIAHAQLERIENHQKQLEKSLYADRYTNHKKIFMELCTEVEKSCRGRLSLVSPTRLYRKMFPENSLKRCEYVMDSGVASGWVESWNAIDKILLKPKENISRASEAIVNIATLAGSLDVVPVYSGTISEFYFTNGQDRLGYGLHDIYNIHFDLMRAIELLVDFGGRSDNKLNYVTHDKAGTIDLLWRDLLELHNRGGLILDKKNEAAAQLHLMYSEVKSKIEDGFNSVDERNIWERLSAALESSEKLEGYLLNKEAMSDLVVLSGMKVAGVDAYKTALEDFRSNRL